MSWCNCSLAVEDGPEFHSSTIRRARRVHQCCECGQTISRGEEYEYVSGKWDGRLDQFKTCLKCEDIRKHFCPDGWLYGGLDETLRATLDIRLADVHGFWLMPGKDRTIAMLVDLVCELLEKEEKS